MDRDDRLEAGRLVVAEDDLLVAGGPVEDARGVAGAGWLRVPVTVVTLPCRARGVGGRLGWGARSAGVVRTRWVQGTDAVAGSMRPGSQQRVSRDRPVRTGRRDKVRDPK